MASNRKSSGGNVEQSDRKARQGVEHANESGAENNMRRNDGSPSSSTRHENVVSDRQNAPDSQDYHQRMFRRDSINDSTRAARDQQFDGNFVDSGREASGFFDQSSARGGGERQESMSSRHARNVRQHRQQPTSFRNGLGHEQDSQSMRQDEHQARPNPTSLREQAARSGRNVVDTGAYWKPSPGAGCQKAPPPGGSRGFNPSGTVPDYGGLEIWHDDEGKNVERRGRGGRDNGSFDP